MGTHMKTTLDLSDAVLDQAKAHAARHGLTLRTVVEDALRRYLAQQASGAPRKTLKIVPFDGGGFAPGYESKSWNEILEEVNERPMPEDDA